MTLPWSKQPRAEPRISFLDPAKRADPLACRVCGHRTVPIVRRSVNGLLLLLLGALLCYITLDVLENGKLDGSLLAMIRARAVVSGSR
ncbi:MAG TPA: hypothetical protein VGU22_17655 [Methylomirabilota bacterium]|jgi:hypothetical protein|nr:hypothetical protein [Methylomirabilota bacterium]